MVIYVEDKVEFDKFLSEFDTKPSSIYIQLSDANKHALNNRISFVVVKIDLQIYVININHTDGLGLREDALHSLTKSPQIKSVVDAKNVTQLLYLQSVVDIDLYQFICDGEVEEIGFRDLQSFYKRSIPKPHQSNINDSIPITKQVGLIKKKLISCGLRTRNLPAFNFSLHALEVFKWIELSGLKVDETLAPLLGTTEHINKDGMIFTQYNLHTSTLRPSNRHGGINFTSLPKESGIRKAFVSRFKDGKMVSIDYTAYHPHLLIDLFKKELKNIPNGGLDWIDKLKDSRVDFYMWIASQLGVADLDNARDEAKKLVFQSIYGGVGKELQNIDFFREVHALTLQYKSDIDKYEFVKTPVYGMHINLSRFGEDNPSPAKILNYVIQCYETERNIGILKSIKQNYKGIGKLIMYNYDAFVFDVPNYEIQYLYENIYEQIIDSKEFPSTIVTGDNYDFR